MARKTLIAIVLGLTATCITAIPIRAAERYDVLIRSARIVDGTGRAAVVGDVGIRDGRIMGLGDLGGATAAEEIDAKGRIVCPGFIDLHNHGDRGILKHRDAENYVRQGATTLLCGNCGSSPVDVAGFLRSVREGGAGVNIAVLIGHGSVRRAVVGPRSVAPTSGQLAEMQKLVRRAMEAGAVGMSTGLRYRPGAYASTEEVVALAREIAPFGGFYATHMRNEGPNILVALDEALRIGREASVPVHVSHHKISSASVWGLTRLTLKRIDQARAAGHDVTLDHYPYGAGSTGISLMVPQTSLSGGSGAFRARIKDPQQRSEILAAVRKLMIVKLFEPGQNPDSPADIQAAIARIQISRSPGDASLEGKHLAEILELRKQPATLDAAAELVVELVDQGARAIYHTIDDRAGGDVERVMGHAHASIASDGVVLAHGSGHPHPRSYGTYPRVFAKYVRERKILDLERAVHKMTGLPAARLGFTDRGLIKAGYWADLVLFDVETMRDLATFRQPHQYAEGVDLVMIRGQAVLKNGRPTGARPGRPVYGVAVAATLETRVRRELYQWLARHDGRFAVLAAAADGEPLLAINADDAFDFAGIDALPVEKKTMTLRESVSLLAAGRRDRIIVQPDEDKHQHCFVAYRRCTAPDGKLMQMAMVYDFSSNGRLPADQQAAIAELVERRIFPRLTTYRFPRR